MKMEFPIRVLCVFSSLDRGGEETMCMNLYRAINREKVQFDFVKHTTKKCEFEDEIHKLGGKIYKAPPYMVYNYLQYCRWWERHLRQHPEHRIIHGHLFTIASIYFKIARRYKRVTIAHSHASAQSKGLKGWLKRPLKKELVSYSDYCLSCSEIAEIRSDKN